MRCSALARKKRKQDPGALKAKDERRRKRLVKVADTFALLKDIIINCVHHSYLGFEENGEEDSVTEAAGGVRGPYLPAPGAGGQTAGRGGLQPGGGGQGAQHEGLGPALLHQVHTHQHNIEWELLFSPMFQHYFEAMKTF